MRSGASGTLAGDAVVTLDGVRFSYDGSVSWALDGVSLTIRQGEYVCLTGANGSGKSTLARLVAGLAAPDGGTVSLLGERVFDGAPDADAYRSARRGIGAVFQNPADQIVTTVVADDVAFGPENLDVDPAAIGERVTDALATVGLDASADADPTRMSGGQQQRLAIGGMIAMRPRLLVLDEPTAMLDAAARADVIATLARLHAAGTTIVHVTHHPDEMLAADREIRLDRGRIVADGWPDARAVSGLVPVLDVTGADHSGDVTTADTGAPSHVAAAAGHSVDVTTGDLDRSLASDVVHPTGATRFTGSSPTPDGEGPTAPAVLVSDVRYRYPDADRPAIDGLSLRVESGETVALMGGNGVGKSTLLRLIAGLARPDVGSIAVAGIPVARERRSRVGIGFGGRRRPVAISRGDAVRGSACQPSLLAHERRNGSGNGSANGSDARRPVSFPHRRPAVLSRRDAVRLRRMLGYVMQLPERQLFADTVLDDVMFGPRNQGLSEAEARGRAVEALALLGVAHLADRSPFALSGGQRRLVAIAGVVACRPRVLLLDEPTAGLDADARGRVVALLRALHGDGVTIVMVTHDRAEAAAVSARVVMLDASGSHHAGDSTDAADTTGIASIPAATGASDSTGADHTIVDHTVSGDATTIPPRRRPPLARLDPRVLTVATLALMMAAFAIGSLPRLSVFAIATALYVAAARVRPRSLWRMVWPLLAVCVFVGALNLLVVTSGTPLLQAGPLRITDEGVRMGVLYAGRFALVIVLGTAFMRSVTPTTVADAAASLLSPLARLGVHTQEIALVLSLALRFLPTLADEARAVVDAQTARGGDIGHGSPIVRLRALAATATPMLAGAVRHADTLALALDARCYEAGAHRTRWHAMRAGAADAVFVLLVAAAIAAVLPLW
ncbi:energy-coupling factor transporter ATPase [Bifidobacterium samirii]|uniref:Cobalt ABC transporter n=1 Tax=Bifidobacterium samirii TaxID=2306974 RepID=A0A430FU48_9BIFI|nr:energy-coupling factor transporter ATPase [Bifidobacterium samirii]RSX56382.1 cobalt ABC transporter [Bifidobacterium samirii]